MFKVVCLLCYNISDYTADEVIWSDKEQKYAIFNFDTWEKQNQVGSLKLVMLDTFMQYNTGIQYVLIAWCHATQHSMITAQWSD